MSNEVTHAKCLAMPEDGQSPVNANYCFLLLLVQDSNPRAEVLVLLGIRPKNLREAMEPLSKNTRTHTFADNFRGCEHLEAHL